MVHSSSSNSESKVESVLVSATAMRTGRVEVSVAPFARHAMRRPDESGWGRMRERNLLELVVERIILFPVQGLLWA